MLTKTLSEAKKKQRNILIKAMNNDIGSIDSAKDSWNPAQISERAKDISYIRSLVDSWNPAQLNEALKMLDLPIIDTWNPAQSEEQRRNLVFYLAERTLTGNPITLKILGNLTPEVTDLKVTMNPIQSGTGDPSPTNIRPITGRTEVSVTRTGLNLYGGEVFKDEVVEQVPSATVTTNTVAFGAGAVSGKVFCTDVKFKPNTAYTFRMKCQVSYAGTNTNLRVYYTDNTYIDFRDNSQSDADTDRNIVITTNANKTIQELRGVNQAGTTTVYLDSFGVFEGTRTFEEFESYTGETKTHEYSETIYGGSDDFVNGLLSVEWDYIASYDGETLPDEWISDRDVYAPDTTPSTGAEVVYRLETPTTVETTPEEITLLKGTNVLSTDGDSIELKYKQNF